MTEAIIGKQFPGTVIPLIENAKNTIKIVVFDWRWYPNDPANPVQLFNQAIIRSVRRGVKVQAIGNCSDVMAILKQQGCDIVKPTTKNLVHAKMMIIDDDWLILGSHNYSKSAFSRNQEASIAVHGREEIKRYREYFNNLWNQYF